MRMTGKVTSKAPGYGFGVRNTWGGEICAKRGGQGRLRSGAAGGSKKVIQTGEKRG